MEGTKSTVVCIAVLVLALLAVPTVASAATFSRWYVRNANTTGVDQFWLDYGEGSQTPVAGDWDGDGDDTPGMFQVSTGRWWLANSFNGTTQAYFAYGSPGMAPVVGDWNGDRRTSVGVKTGGQWHLTNSNSSAPASSVFTFGNPSGDIPLSGDWDGNGTQTPGLYRVSNHAFYLSNSPTGSLVSGIVLGIAGDVPVVGDWNGDGRDSIGVFRASNSGWYLSNGLDSTAELVFAYGSPGDVPVVGDWDGNGTDTPAVVRTFNVASPPAETVVPEMDLGGELYDERDEPLTGDGYELWVDTDDAGSGVTAIQIWVDGALRSSTSEACAGGGCSLEHEWTFERAAFAVGAHTVTVRVIDGAANVAAQSFTVDLSGTRSADDNDPARDTSASDFTAYSEATTASDRCDGFGRGLGSQDPDDVASEDLALYRETSFAYPDGSYLVIRCRPDGSLIEAQEVGPLDTPSGTFLVPEAITLPGDEPDTYETSFPAYADPEEPDQAAAWARDGAAAAGRILPPTDGLMLTPAAAAAASDVKCGSDRKPLYKHYSWGRNTWFYNLREDTIPTEFNSPRNITRVTERIRDGVRTWNTTRNGCHKPRLRDRFITAIRPNETDRANTGYVEFVADDVPCPGANQGPEIGRIIACTHVDTSGTLVVTGEGLKLQAIKGNIRFLKDDDQRYWVRRKTRGCFDRTDLWALAAHEVAHVVGLKDLYGSANRLQSSYGIINRCVFSHRRLGRADYVGFKALYLP